MITQLWHSVGRGGGEVSVSNSTAPFEGLGGMNVVDPGGYRGKEEKQSQMAVAWALKTHFILHCGTVDEQHWGWLQVRYTHA